jgi:hypothetical protein
MPHRANGRFALRPPGSDQRLVPTNLGFGHGLTPQCASTHGSCSRDGCASAHRRQAGSRNGRSAGARRARQRTLAHLCLAVVDAGRGTALAVRPLRQSSAPDTRGPLTWVGGTLLQACARLAAPRGRRGFVSYCDPALGLAASVYRGSGCRAGFQKLLETREAPVEALLSVARDQRLEQTKHSGRVARYREFHEGPAVVWSELVRQGRSELTRRALDGLSTGGSCSTISQVST